MIYTIGPYLLPDLVRQNIARTPQMPLMLQENFTVKLLEMLRAGEIDCAIMAEPFPDTGLAMAPLYDEPFMAAVPAHHPLAERESVSSDELKKETMLLLGTGHCFRDHVLEVCPEFARFSSNAEGIRKSFEGSSLETIKHMVAAGMGVTLVPRLSVPNGRAQAQGQGPQGRRADRALPPGTRRAGRRAADAPRGAGLAPQLHALRGHRGAAQRHLRLRAAGRQAPLVEIAPSAYVPGPGVRNGCDRVRLLRSPLAASKVSDRQSNPEERTRAMAKVVKKSKSPVRCTVRLRRQGAQEGRHGGGARSRAAAMRRSSTSASSGRTAPPSPKA